MTEFKKIRVTILILMIILMGSSTIFVGRTYTNIRNTQRDLEAMEEYANVAQRDFINLSILIQETFIKTIEERFEQEKSFFYSTSKESAIFRLEEHLDAVLNQAYNSLIVSVVDEGKVIYKGFIVDEYPERFRQIDWANMITSNKVQIVDTLDGRSRLYISSTTLDAVSRQFDVFVIFDEEVMLDAMIEGFSIDLLQSTSYHIERILIGVAIYMLAVVVLSILIMLYLRKLYVDHTTGKCPYYGNHLCISFKEGINEKDRLDS